MRPLFFVLMDALRDVMKSGINTIAPILKSDQHNSIPINDKYSLDDLVTTSNKMIETIISAELVGRLQCDTGSVGVDNAYQQLQRYAINRDGDINHTKLVEPIIIPRSYYGFKRGDSMREIIVKMVLYDRIVAVMTSTSDMVERYFTKQPRKQNDYIIISYTSHSVLVYPTADQKLVIAEIRDGRDYPLYTTYAQAT